LLFDRYYHGAHRYWGFANPYLAKPGERSTSIRIATCAVSGGFIDLYTAMDNGLFDKSGRNFEYTYIQASAGGRLS